MHRLCWANIKINNLRGRSQTPPTALSSKSDLLQGNAGDSRSVLGVKGRAKPLSFDHKPQNEGSDYTVQTAMI